MTKQRKFSKDSIDERAERIVDLLLKTRDIHPYLALPAKEIAKQLYGEVPDSEIYKRLANQNRVKRAMRRATEIGESHDLVLASTRKPTKKDPKRFSHIYGYRFLQEFEERDYAYTELIYSVQRELDVYKSNYEWRQAVIKSGVLTEAEIKNFAAQKRLIHPSVEKIKEVEAFLKELQTKKDLVVHKVQFLEK